MSFVRTTVRAPSLSRRRSSAGITSAACIAAAVASTSNGLMESTFPRNSSCAPAFSESTITPSVLLTSAPSFATRFRPSYTGLTRSTSKFLIAAIALRSLSAISSRIGCHSAVPNSLLIRPAVCRMWRR